MRHEDRGRVSFQLQPLGRNCTLIARMAFVEQKGSNCVGPIRSRRGLDLKTSGLSYREFVEIEPYFGSDLMPAIQLESIALCESALSADSTPSLRTDGCRQPAVA